MSDMQQRLEANAKRILEADREEQISVTLPRGVWERIVGCVTFTKMEMNVHSVEMGKGMMLKQYDRLDSRVAHNTAMILGGFVDSSETKGVPDEVFDERIEDGLKKLFNAVTVISDAIYPGISNLAEEFVEEQTKKVDSLLKDIEVAMKAKRPEEPDGN